MLLTRAVAMILAIESDKKSANTTKITDMVETATACF